MTEEETFDKVLKVLSGHPHTLGELHAEFNFVGNTDDVQDALDVLEDLGVLNERQEPRSYNDGKNHRLIPVFEIRRECKLDRKAIKEWRNQWL